MLQTTTWNIDPSHTGVEFSVRHLMIATVKGRFGDVSGTVELDPTDPTTARLDVTIGTASVDTRVADRDKHLRSADFFDVEKFPAMTYRSRKVERTGEGEYRVLGDLTIKGVTREVPLAVEFLGETRDPWGNERIAASATGKINRHDFGLDWNAALETGGVLVGPEVKIALDVQLVKQAAAAAA